MSNPIRTFVTSVNFECTINSVFTSKLYYGTLKYELTLSNLYIRSIYDSLIFDECRGVRFCQDNIIFKIKWKSFRYIEVLVCEMRFPCAYGSYGSVARAPYRAILRYLAQ